MYRTNTLSYSPISSPSDKFSLPSFDFETIERDQNIKLIKEICYLLVILQAIMFSTGILQIIVTREFSAFLRIGVGFVSIILYFVTYKLSKNGKYFTASRLLLLCVFLNVGILYLFLGNQVPMATVLTIPIFLSLALLDTRAILFMTVVSVMLGIGITMAESLFHFYKPPFTLTTELKPLGIILCILISIPASGWLVVIALNNKRQLMSFQNIQLQAMLRELGQKQHQGIQISQEVLTLAGDLNKVAEEQAGESQKQLNSITNVTVSLEELNESANQISVSAGASTQSAYQTVEIANNVKSSSELASNTVEKGNEVVLEAVKSVERVRERIELLGQKLLRLTEQTRDVGSIIGLIEEISDETHLLALNASIEAAGGLQGTNQNGNSGARFGVVAQEVKNLADRSRIATGEVRESIREMQGAVAAAVLVAEEGKKETVAALNRSYKAGEVIVNLSEVIQHNASQSNLIVEASEEVKTRCDAIVMASAQQKSASQQVLETLRVLNEIARHNAEGSDLILSNAFKLEEVSGKFEVTLGS